MTPSDGRNTWGRTAVCKKEDLAGTKKKGRTWGPSSTHQRERVGGEDRYLQLHPYTVTDAEIWIRASKFIKIINAKVYRTRYIKCHICCRLKSLGEGKVWSSSAPNLGKSPKHVPITGGFSSLSEMGESTSIIRKFFELFE